jgi:hypothetical protein
MNDSFAELVDRTARQAGLNDYQLSGAIGLLPSKRIYSPKQVGRLRRGQVRHVDRELVDRLIDVLDLDRFDAYEAADLRPEGFTADDHRSFALAAQGHAAEAASTPSTTGSNPYAFHNLRLVA